MSGGALPGESETPYDAMPRLVAVVAMARNQVIGREGAMPWSLPADLKRYRRLTMGKPMIMGRKTLLSIGRVLDGRDSVVLTRGAELPFDGAHLAASPDEALRLAEGLAAERRAQEIVVAGGAEVYRLFFDLVTRLYVTHVEAEPEGDAHFPPIDPAVWSGGIVGNVRRREGDSAASHFYVYDRMAAV